MCDIGSRIGLLYGHPSCYLQPADMLQPVGLELRYPLKPPGRVRKPPEQLINPWGMSGMQYDDGDVLVKLSRNPKHWMILPSDRLAAASPVLGASFKKLWANNARFVFHPGRQRLVKVFVLSLQRDERIGALFLQSQDVPYMPHDFTDADIPWPRKPLASSTEHHHTCIYSLSDLQHGHARLNTGHGAWLSPSTIWTKILGIYTMVLAFLASIYSRVEKLIKGRHDYSARLNGIQGLEKEDKTHWSSGGDCCCRSNSNDTVVTFKMLLALLIGVTFSLDTFFRMPIWRDLMCVRHVSVMYDVLAYGDLFMCEDLLKAELRRKINESDLVWKHDGFRAILGLRLAKDLGHREFYLDLVRAEALDWQRTPATRHANNHHALDMPRDEFDLLVSEKEEHRLAILSELKEELHKLVLHQATMSWPQGSGGRKDKTFLFSSGHATETAAPGFKKEDLDARSAAKFLWSQFLALHLYLGVQMTEGDVDGGNSNADYLHYNEVGTFPEMIQKLRRAAKEDCPHEVFGTAEIAKVVSFHGHDEDNAVRFHQKLEWALDDIIHQAIVVIENVLCSADGRQVGNTTYRETRWSREGKSEFTYIGLDESTACASTPIAIAEEPELIDKYEAAPASYEWLQAIWTSDTEARNGREVDPPAGLTSLPNLETDEEWEAYWEGHQCRQSLR